MGEDYKDNHIVPKRYLDRFAEKGRKQNLIGTRVFEDDKAKFFLQSTENVGYITDFYDVTDKGDVKYWEKYFANNQDALCGQPLSGFISVINLSKHMSVVLSETYKDMLSRIIVSQLFRVPNSLEFIKRIHDRTRSEIKKELLPMFSEDRKEQFLEAFERVKLSPQQQKELFFNRSFDPKRFDMYCRILKKRLWSVLYNTRSNLMPFVTSDNPVLVENLFTGSQNFFDTGLLNSGTIFFYPITKEIAITNFSLDGLHYILSLRATSEFGEEYYWPPSVTADMLADKLFFIEDDKYVMYKNQLVLNQAYKHGFLPQPLYDEIKKAERQEAQGGK